MGLFVAVLLWYLTKIAFQVDWYTQATAKQRETRTGSISCTGSILDWFMNNFMASFISTKIYLYTVSNQSSQESIGSIEINPKKFLESIFTLQGFILQTFILFKFVTLLYVFNHNLSWKFSSNLFDFDALLGIVDFSLHNDKQAVQSFNHCGVWIW